MYNVMLMYVTVECTPDSFIWLDAAVEHTLITDQLEVVHSWHCVEVHSATLVQCPQAKVVVDVVLQRLLNSIIETLSYLTS